MNQSLHSIKILIAIFFTISNAVAFGQFPDNTPGVGKTFTVPANVTHINVAAWGSGGGGGGSNAVNSTGNGGGGGGASSNQIAVASGNIFTYTIVAGGTAGAAAAAGKGGNGGNTTITSPNPLTSMTANGGTGGLGNNVPITSGNSEGGTASGGTVSNGSPGIKGGKGGISGTGFNISGVGGGVAIGSAGIVGGNPGAGGGGGDKSGITNRAGGAGAPGGVLFDYITVSSVSPSPACIGDKITITGTNFSASGTTTVTVNGIVCTNVTFISATSITAIVAAGTTTGVVDINNNGLRNNGKSITVNPSPAATIVSGGGTFCTNATITASGGTGGMMYFQGTASGGTSTTTPSTSQIVTTSGTYYFRSQSASGCWGVEGSVVVTITPVVTGVAGIPIPANSATGVCYAGIPITNISWSPVTDATSYDVYFGAGTLPGIITANVGTTTYPVGTLLANTTYYWKVVPKNSCGVTTGLPVTWTFTTSNAPCYCTSSGGTIADGITGVKLNTLNNLGTAVNISYTDYTSLSTILTKGSSYNLEVYINTGGNYTNYQTAYIDWNGNGNFSDAGETFALGSATNVANGLSNLTPLPIVVPTGATTGTVRMRIQSQYNSATTNSCATGFDGEVEDYSIIIIPTTPCLAPTTQPSALNLITVGSTINGSFTAAPGVNSYLVIANTTGVAPTISNGTTYAIGANLGSTNFVVDTDSNTIFSTASLIPFTKYYFFIYSMNNLCTGGPLYLSSSPLTGNATTSYCSSTGSGSAFPISNVTFGGINNNSSATTYYEDFSSITGNVVGGTSYTFAATATGAAGNPFGVYAYFDWNNNGDFSDDGGPYTIGTYTTATATVSAPIQIPITAYNGGPIRFRVINQYNVVPPSCPSGGSLQVEDYSLNIAVAPPCTPPTTQPTALVLTPAATSIAGSFTAAAAPVPQNYLVVMNTTGTPPTALITNGNTYPIGSSIGVSNTVIDTDSNTIFTAGGLNTTSTYYFYIYAMNALCTGGPLYNKIPTVLIGNATTVGTPPNPCMPTTVATRNSSKYISRVAFIGTKLDTNNTSTFSTVTPGYQDFTNTGLTKAIQIQGEGINMIVESLGGRTRLRAWVDWNKNGTFEPSELVYGPPAAGISSTFGFIIPTGTVSGDYRIRLRTFNSYYGAGSTEYFGLDFDACQPFDTGNVNGNSSIQYGEAEDYLFTVIERCDANIISTVDGQVCNSGAVKLTATGTAGTTEYRWYADPTGGSQLPGSPTTGSWVTPSITTTTTYYVTAYNGSCESKERKPVIAKVNFTPVISFVPSATEVCGESINIAIAATGDKQISNLLFETFEGAGLGTFTNNNSDATGAPTKADTKFTKRASTFIPAAGISWKPAISTGLAPNNFALATSDAATPAYELIENSLVSGTLNSTDYLNLSMTLKFYYSRYYPDGTGITDEFVTLDISTDGGGNWTTLQTFTADTGIGTIFQDITPINLNSYINQTNLKVRILHHSLGSATGWLPDGVAVDDIRIYGDKPLATNFAWTGDVASIFAADCVSAAPVGGSASICVKTDFQTKSSWTINANATLSNGCTATGTIIIPNNSKIWSTLPAETDWNTAKWSPDTGIPSSNKCVVIRTPVILGAGAEGFAKNVRIETSGKLTIKKDQALTVTDAFITTVLPKDVLIESDGNLIQINEGSNINTGTITAKRDIILSAGRQQYNYMMSPLENQSLATVYKDASGNPVSVPYVLYHNEATNKFYTSSGAYIKGRGLAIKEPAIGFAPTTMGSTFTGKPTNGAFTYGIVKSGAVGDINRGYNLIGNPYPSNIDLVKFFTINGGTGGNLSSTAYFWDNRANDKTTQYGDLYGGQSYGQVNMTSGTGAAGLGDLSMGETKVPTQYVKTGQGFMVKSKIASANISFNNTIRTKTKGLTDFFGKNEGKTDSPMDRYWLNMITPTNIASNIAVVYFPEGNNGFTQDDSRTMGGSDAVYSIVENESVSINGRSSFINTDIIPLGSQHFAAGNYTIALAAKEGIFANGQSIYLKDKQTGIVTNLSQGNYTFTANAGSSTGRFDIVYIPETVLATNGNLKESLLIYKDGNDFVVKAQTKKITNLDLFDAAGRLMRSFHPNNVKAVIPADQLSNGVYLLKINQNGEITTRKIVR